MNLKKLLKSNDFGYYEKRLCFLLLLSTIPNAFSVLQSLVNHFTPPFRCDLSSIVNNAKKETVLSKTEFTSDEQQNEYLLNLTIPYVQTDVESSKRSSCTRYNVSLEYLQNLTNHTLAPLKNKTLEHEIVSCSSFHFEGKEVSAVTEISEISVAISTFIVYFEETFWHNVWSQIHFFVVHCAAIHCLIRYKFRHNTSAIWNPGVPERMVRSRELWFRYFVRENDSTKIGFEFVLPDYRSFTYFVLAFGYGVGSVLVGPIAYFTRNWRWYMGFSGLMGIPYIAYFWLIDESPLWLAAKGKDEELEIVLRKVARMNKQKKKTKEEIKKLLPSETDARKTCFKAGVEIISNRMMMTRILIASFSWCVMNMSYFAIVLNNNNLSGNRFVNVSIGGAVEVLAYVIFYIIVDSFGRRKSYMITMTCCAAGIAFTPLAEIWSEHLVVVLSMFGRLTTSIGFAIIYVHHVEFFPTPTRQTVMGICSACG
ncbi:unnamed protein product [Clavelina lepadiformis]|uniref:Uncharacterized protein n=1 Tax=Clavelina lepadiformis TaxID=159417 RepID=A0ABP0FUD9_CLALP